MTSRLPDVDKFEIVLEGDEEDVIKAAINELVVAVAAVAYKHKVCPTCLTYTFADMISDLEERGAISHMSSEQDGWCRAETVQ